MEALPIIIAVVGVIAAIIAYIVGSHSSDTKVLALKEKLDALGSQPQSSASKKSNPKSKSKSSSKPASTSNDSKKLNDLKDTVKKTKNQLHNAKQEIKSLKDAVKTHERSSKNKGSKQDADLIFNLRAEVGDLKSALENAKAAAKVKKEKPSVFVEKAVETEGMDEASREAINELEKSHRAKLKATTEKHRKAEKEIRQKLKAASSNVDKQRRRADNNDRAYKITQRQVDALQERISFLEKGPNDKPVALQAAASVPAAIQVSEEVRVTAKLPANTDDASSRSTMTASEADDVPGGLSAPSEPTTIEMSPDIAETLFSTSKDGQLSIDDMMASPSSVEEEPSRQTMRLDDVRLTNELESPQNTKLSESSAVDDAWAEFDVD